MLFGVVRGDVWISGPDKRASCAGGKILKAKIKGEGKVGGDAGTIDHRNFG